MLCNLTQPLSKQDMQEGYVFVSIHTIKNIASPYISLHLFLYKITLITLIKKIKYGSSIRANVKKGLGSMVIHQVYLLNYLYSMNGYTVFIFCCFLSCIK